MDCHSKEYLNGIAHQVRGTEAGGMEADVVSCDTSTHMVLLRELNHCRLCPVERKQYILWCLKMSHSLQSFWKPVSQQEEHNAGSSY